MSAKNAGSGGNHRFPAIWNLTDLENVPKNGKKVFSCFSCGGGSSMGYKLAGYTVIGNCEIDKDMIAIYRANHNPKHSYLMDIRDFNNIPLDELPDELKDLDILDGSPPCSVFSTAGKREQGWNTEKVFREGQAAQRLDDLFFRFIETATRLQPKVVIAENVKGLITGAEKGYVNEILKAFAQAGYVVQLFLLNAATMGVPQKRERVFFVAHRKDLDYPKLSLNIKEQPVTFGDVRGEHGRPLTPGSMLESLLSFLRPVDTRLDHINKRVRGKEVAFGTVIAWDHEPMATVVSGGDFVRAYDKLKFCREDFVGAQTFPQDYDFGKESPQYVCGMSVTPVMMAHIASAVYEQWLR